MKKVVLQMKRTLSAVLALMMVATAVPQTAMPVIAAENNSVIVDDSLSKGYDVTVEEVAVDEIIAESAKATFSGTDDEIEAEEYKFKQIYIEFAPGCYCDQDSLVVDGNEITGYNPTVPFEVLNDKCTIQVAGTGKYVIPTLDDITPKKVSTEYIDDWFYKVATFEIENVEDGKTYTINSKFETAKLNVNPGDYTVTINDSYSEPKAVSGKSEDVDVVKFDYPNTSIYIDYTDMDEPAVKVDGKFIMNQGGENYFESYYAFQDDAKIEVVKAEENNLKIECSEAISNVRINGAASLEKKVKGFVVVSFSIPDECRYYDVTVKNGNTPVECDYYDDSNNCEVVLQNIESDTVLTIDAKVKNEYIPLEITVSGNEIEAAGIPEEMDMEYSRSVVIAGTTYLEVSEKSLVGVNFMSGVDADKCSVYINDKPVERYDNLGWIYGYDYFYEFTPAVKDGKISLDISAKEINSKVTLVAEGQSDNIISDSVNIDDIYDYGFSYDKRADYYVSKDVENHILKFELDPGYKAEVKVGTLTIPYDETVKGYKLGKITDDTVVNLKVSADKVKLSIDVSDIKKISADKMQISIGSSSSWEAIPTSEIEVDANKNVYVKFDYTDARQYTVIELGDATVDRAQTFDTVKAFKFKVDSLIGKDGKVTLKAIEGVNADNCFWFEFGGTGNYVAKDKSGKDVTAGKHMLEPGATDYEFSIVKNSDSDEVVVEPYADAAEKVSVSMNGLSGKVIFAEDAATGQDDVAVVNVSTSKKSGSFQIVYDHNKVDVTVIAGDVKLRDNGAGLYTYDYGKSASVSIKAKPGVKVDSVKTGETGINVKNKATASWEAKFDSVEDAKTYVIDATANEIVTFLNVQLVKDFRPDQNNKITLPVGYYSVETARVNGVTSFISENSIRISDESVVLEGVYEEGSFGMTIPESLNGKNFDITYTSVDGYDTSKSVTRTVKVSVPSAVTSVKLEGQESLTKNQAAASIAKYKITTTPANAALEVSFGDGDGVAIDRAYIDKGYLYVITKAIPLADRSDAAIKESVTVKDPASEKKAVIEITNVVPDINIVSASVSPATYNAVDLKVERNVMNSHEYLYDILGVNYGYNRLEYRVSVSQNAVGTVGSYVYSPNYSSKKDTFRLKAEGLLSNTDTIVDAEIVMLTYGPYGYGEPVVVASKKYKDVLTCKTKEAYFASTLKLKQKTKKIYADQEKVLLATPDFGKNVTASDYLDIVIDGPEGNSAEALQYGYSVDEYGKIYIIPNGEHRVYHGPGVYDYDTYCYQLSPGKYTLTAYTATDGGDKRYAASASVSFTIEDRSLTIVPSMDTVYKKNGKKVDITLTLYSNATGKKVKNNSLYYNVWPYYVLVDGVWKYIGDYDSDYREYLSKNIKINSKTGKISIAKGLVLSEPVWIDVDSYYRNTNSWAESCKIILTPYKQALGRVEIGNWKGGKFIVNQERTVTVGDIQDDWDRDFDFVVVNPDVREKTEYTRTDLAAAGLDEIRDNYKLIWDKKNIFKTGTDSEGNFYAKFKDAGKVTFKVSAKDGSGQSKSIAVTSVAKPVENITFYPRWDSDATTELTKTYHVSDSNWIYSFEVGLDGPDFADSKVSVKVSNAVIKYANMSGDSAYYGIMVKNPKKPAVITIKDGSSKKGKTYTYKLYDDSPYRKKALKTFKQKSIIYSGLKEVWQGCIYDDNQELVLNVSGKDGYTLSLEEDPSFEKTVDKWCAEPEKYEDNIDTYNNMMQQQEIYKNKSVIFLDNTVIKKAGSYKYFAVVYDSYGNPVCEPKPVTIKVSALKAKGTLKRPSEIKMGTAAGGISSNEIADVKFSVTGLKKGDKVAALDINMEGIASDESTVLGLRNACVDGQFNTFTDKFAVRKFGNQYKIYVKNGNLKDFASRDLIGYLTYEASYGIKSDGTPKTEIKAIKITIKKK